MADASRSIVQLLVEHMVPEPITQPERIGLSHPSDKGDLQLSLFLYHISENGTHRQTESIRRGHDQLQHPPMSVDLHYLITAHSSAELQARALDEQRILGRAMQVLYDHSILRSPNLMGTLAEKNEVLRIVLEESNLDIIQNFFPDTPFKLSLAYTVGPIQIDSRRIQTTKRVLEKNIHLQG
ncbi:DUF4255 domain-containing protein [Bacillus horti]|uniref:Pvc16 N-terminal domain-containing protein n=1 Tax=Caldalkalibacillus horti TaxID=77523 RepID=A0ABT9VZX7_9BACI|nr:DUF4255 domain-containing protein [Bacillus horti]MDQ0166555.1 hypothetical protein [Bacillus horti]